MNPHQMASDDGYSSTGLSDYKDHTGAPRSLSKALRAAGIPLDRSSTGSETPSEEDYDVNIRPALTGTGEARRRRIPRPSGTTTPDGAAPSTAHTLRRDSGIHIVPDDDKSIQEFLQRSSQRAKESVTRRRPGASTGVVFTRQFSAFDRQNSSSVNNPFHGFFTLFWLGVSLFVFKIFANNWRNHGSPLGTNDIMRIMFTRDIIVLLLSDGIMCGATGVSWFIQRLVINGYLNWDRSGWIIQNIWQSLFFGSVVGLTLWREWPWTHTVFFVLHGIIMLMKQHSYAFYNGHLSTVLKKRSYLIEKLKQLDLADPSTIPSETEPLVSTLSTSHLDIPPSAEHRRQTIVQLCKDTERDIDKISNAIASRQPLDDAQIRLFERLMKWEIAALSDELKGTATDVKKAYPNNLTFKDHYKWIPLPTLVYELDYPRSDSISWSYLAEKSVAMVGIIFVMNIVSQYSIYPVVMKALALKEDGVPLAGRMMEFPWLLGDLIFPFMMEYLLVWYLIWETILNILAELTYFADRSFYDAWWNSVSWDQFARDWNRPVHIFLLRHVYHSSISSMKVNKYTATLITFFLSACVHELVMWCLFKKLRGYLLFLQMCQLPLVRLSRTKWLRGRQTLGNLFFWLGICTGPSLLCSLYLII